MKENAQWRGHKTKEEHSTKGHCVFCVPGKKEYLYGQETDKKAWVKKAPVRTHKIWKSQIKVIVAEILRKATKEKAKKKA